MGLRITAMLAIVGAITGFFLALAIPPRYEASATLRFLRLPGMPQSMYDQESRLMLDAAAARALTRESLTVFIGRNSRLRERLSSDPVDEVIDKLRQGTRIEFASLPGGVKGISIRFEDDDADDALDTARELAVQIASLAKSASLNNDGKEVTELAGLPFVAPAGVTVPLATSLGFLAGLIAGLLACLVSRTPSQILER